jgi:hypothetical protein
VIVEKIKVRHSIWNENECKWNSIKKEQSGKYKKSVVIKIGGEGSMECKREKHLQIEQN